jgi:hypothetical protein
MIYLLVNDKKTDIKRSISMFKKLFFCIAVIALSSLFAYDFEEEGEHLSCVISMEMKMTPVYPDDKTGRAFVIVTMKDKSGNPLSGKQIDFSASWGTFQCQLPEDIMTDSGESVDDRSCFTTDLNGKAKVNLINIQLNSPIKVKATCDCGGYTVSATGSLTMRSSKKK